jgi:alpha-L-fucosidase
MRRARPFYSPLGLLFSAALLFSPFISHAQPAPEPAPEPAPVAFPETVAQRDARTAWWRDARLGLFIHWDMSSVAGTEISWSRKGTRPLDIGSDRAGYVEDPAYDQLYRRFDPVRFDAKEWVRVAQAAGMRYIVLTAKHHGGFSMWDTRLSDYSIMNTPFKRDIVKELADACHAANMRFGLYYSQRDWYHRDYGIGDNVRYTDFMHGQLKELLTRYGTIDVLWFDSYGRGDPKTFWRVPETWALIKTTQPQTVINDRLRAIRSPGNLPEHAGDHDTPEQRIGGFRDQRLWESCMTIVDVPNHDGGWSYRPDGTVKSLAECIQMVASCAVGDGNLLLGIGPDATGVIPADQTARILEMGDWLRTHGESIYGTRGGPFKPWKYGGTTRKGHTVYVHVLKWLEPTLVLPPLPAHVVSSRLLRGGEVKVTQSDAGLFIDVADKDRDPANTVIALEFDADIMGIPAITVPPARHLGLFPAEVKRVLFLGDSITHAGSYVDYVATYHRLRYPDRAIDFINVGLPSETVSGLSEEGHGGGKFPRPDLKERLDRVLAKTKPDLVIACYGMNDGIYLPFDESRFTAYRDGIEHLRRTVSAAGARLTLVTPPVFDEAKGKKPGYAAVLDRYSAWLVSQRDAGWDVVDLHAPMQRQLDTARAADPLFVFAKDGIHPGPEGHWFMAKQILSHLGANDLASTADAAAFAREYPGGSATLAAVQKDNARWRDAWLTATDHTRPGLKAGEPIEIDPATGRARFIPKPATP